MDSSLAELTRSVQAVSDVYAARTGIERDRDWYLLKITEELGELHKAYLRIQRRARPSKEPDADQARELGDEAADVLAHVLLFIAHENIDISEALRRKWLCHIRS